MKTILDAAYTRPLCVYLAAVLIVITAFSGSAEAMFIPAAPQMDADRAADLAVVQKALESKELRQRLADYGLSDRETMTRIDKLSDAQLHTLAANINALQAGGHGSISLTELLLIILIVLLIVIIVQNAPEARTA